MLNHVTQPAGVGSQRRILRPRSALLKTGFATTLAPMGVARKSVIRGYGGRSAHFARAAPLE